MVSLCHDANRESSRPLVNLIVLCIQPRLACPCFLNVVHMHNIQTAERRSCCASWVDLIEVIKHL